MSNVKVLAMSSIKGGVGKSVSSVNIAGTIAEKRPNERIILIDLDPQGNCSQYLRYYPRNIDIGTNDLFENENTTLEECLCPTYKDNLFLVPSEMSLNNVHLALTMGEITYENKNFILKRKIEEYRNNCNVDTTIILDTRPDFDIFTMNALMCAERVLCPVFPCEFAVNGFRILNNSIMNIREKHNKKLRLLGLFKNNWGKANSIVVKQIERELEEYNNLLLDTIIPSTISVEQSKSEGVPLIASSAKFKPVTKAYEELVEEIMNKWQKVVR